jgi:uncharacterized protein
MKMLNSEQRLQKIAQYVQSHLQEMAERDPSPEHDADYRWQHTLRVASYGQQVAEAEGANIEVVVAACLLHDLAHFEAETDYKGHGRLGARLSRSLLEELGYSPADIDNICYSVAVHVDGEAGYAHPATLESKIVSDADNIDRFGAFRVLQWCVDDMHTYEQLIEKLQNRIQRLKEYRQNSPLETPTGQQLFARQLDLQIGFFEALVKESTLTRLPSLPGSE